MSYQQFAYLYDQLMIDAPYDEWVRLLETKAKEYGMTSDKTLLDLACGTGELSVRLAQGGFDVVGADLSEDMLSVAQAKAAKNHVAIQFFQQNMAELEGLGQFDIIGIFCDSLNYLETEDEVIQTFKGVFGHLKDEGLFIFDVHSLYKMSNIFMNQTYALNEDEISYIWQSFAGEYEHSVEHELSFFVLDESSGRYDRYDELHVQRTYAPEIYQAWLSECGFEVLEICADFKAGPVSEDAERVFFICKKK
ncbi:class I SAM-dependent DNA methyltransferase [Cytobacillus purgationiresistens]|uniref:SAM-dependent methyltransferase n=1 Tax=Cytobacillus purgationiresistens TaxID=863449 RepID=A0ABU0AHI9_9BACI|nr:class I SAM-dependent methyltransferase [Cytobacillus purgationiresistens]MDQ0269525.1 SAM-dependent methyltransferase [Cytobacillus purgationiresistens]